MVGGICIIFLLGIIPYSLSAPDPLDALNININLGEGTNQGYASDYVGDSGYGGGYGKGYDYLRRYGYRKYGKKATPGQPSPGQQQPPSGKKATPGQPSPGQQQPPSGLNACPMDERHSFFKCQCGSEECELFEPCAKFNTSKSFKSIINSNRSYEGYFDRNCPTESSECITRCKQAARFCLPGQPGPGVTGDGYPSSCTCSDGKRDVDDPAMCDGLFVRDMDKCTCPDGKEITELPNGEPFYAENVWRKPAADEE